MDGFLVKVMKKAKNQELHKCRLKDCAICNEPLKENEELHDLPKKNLLNLATYLKRRAKAIRAHAMALTGN